MATQTQRHPKLLRRIALGDGSQTVDTLAEALSVSAKTVRRDITAMRSLGIPIEECTKAHGQKTYRIANEAIPQINFAFDEALALMLCQSSAIVYQGTAIGEAAENAFEKILAALGPLQRDYLARMLPRIHQSHVGGDYTGHNEIVEALTIGIEESRATFITYTSARSTEPVTYDIHPYGIAQHRGTLYVVGFSCHHDEIRMWKVDRMLDAAVTEVPFSRPRDFDLENHFAGAFAVVTGDQKVTVRVRFTGTAVRYVQEKQMHPSQAVTVHADGTATAQFDLTSTLEIKSYILSFGASAEVLSPTTLRMEIREELQQAINLYAESTAPRGAS